ncbi:MAG: S8 family serine peptidase [Planctomycetota bacterium]
MKFRIPLLALVAGLAALLAAPGVCDEPPPEDERESASLIIRRDFVIQLKRDELISEVLADYAEFNATLTASMPAHRLYALSLYIALDDDASEGIFSADARFDDEQHNEDNISSDGHTQSFFFRVSATASEFETQPARHQIALETLPRGARGTGVTVAVLDTGVSDHAVLAGKLAPGGWNFVDANADTSDRSDGTDNDGNGLVDELTGHGTFVAGLISSIAPGAMILPVKVLDSDGHGDTFTTAAGIYHAVDQGARVINLSLSLPGDSTVVQTAINYAAAHGAIVVSAVGNAGLLAPDYPAASPNVIGVTAVDATDVLAPFANRDASVTIAAPGVDIVGPTPDAGFALSSGTSFAAAQVSGVAALAAARFPLDSPAAIRQRLLLASRNINAQNPLDLGLFGAGRLNVRWLLNSSAIGPGASFLRIPR